MTTERDKLTLLRLYLDDELEPEACARVEQMLRDDPQLRQTLLFERCLHIHVGRTLSMADYAPPELSESIRASLHDLQAGDEHADPQPQSDIAGAIGPDDAGRSPRADTPSADETGWRRLLVGPRRVNLFAAAAAIVVIAGAVLFGVLGPPIDRVGPSTPNYVVEAARFTSNHHQTCVDDPQHRASELRFSNEATAHRALMQHLGGRRFTLVDLREAGYEFMAAGPCHVPGHRTSAHTMYRPRNGAAADPTVSIYAVPDVGQYRIAEGGPMQPLQWYRANGGPQASHRVMRMTDGQLVYFVVCSDADDLQNVCRLVMQQISQSPDR